MAVFDRISSNVLALAAAAGFTGAAPKTVNGNLVSMADVESQTLSANVRVRLTTNTITVTAKWQVSDDNVTWVDCAGNPNNAANVALATGTGTIATTNINIPAPAGVYGKRYSRLVLTSGVASGGGAGVDEVAALSYNYRRPSPYVS